MYEYKQKMLIFEAQRWVGIKEIGNNAGQIVEMFQKSVNARPSGEPWCCAFVEFCIQMVDKQWDFMNNSSSSDLNSKLPLTELCMNLYDKAPNSAKLSEPEPGCIVIWQFYKNGVATTEGHTGIVIEVNPMNITTIEGNTSDGSGINREGDGVYRRVRSLAGSDIMKIRGYLRPW